MVIALLCKLHIHRFCSLWTAHYCPVVAEVYSLTEGDGREEDIETLPW